LNLAAAGAALALIPLGWALYVAKLLELVDRNTLDWIAFGSLGATSAVALVAVLARLPYARPIDLGPLRGGAGVALVVLAIALIAFAVSGIAAWVRLVVALGAFVVAASSVRLGGPGWRLAAASLAGLAFSLAVLELLVTYRIYPLLPVGVAAIVAPIAAVAYAAGLRSRRSTVV
jgi:hypothetical protein